MTRTDDEKLASRASDEWLTIVDEHPMDCMLRQDRLPHIWCAGCGLGPAMTCYINAIKKSAIPIDKHVCVS